MSQPIGPSDAPSDPACRDCGSATSLVHEGLRDRHFDSGARPGDGADGWKLRRCDACAMHWLSPRPAGDELAALYGEYYTHDAVEPSGFEAWLKRAVPAAVLGYSQAASGFDRLLARAITSLGPMRVLGEIGRAAAMWLPAPGPGQNRLLDVGCGSGLLLARMRSMGWDIAGVEPDASGAQAARQRLPGAEIFSDIADAPAAAFDAIVSSHVVEHLADPQVTLSGCLRALKPGGRIVISTPNPTSAGAARFGSSWLHWDPPRHLQLFGSSNLAALLERVGFSDVRTETSAGSAHFAYYASSVIERDAVMPGLRLGALSLSTRLSGLRFWMSEHARVRRGDPCGEELVAFASRPTAATE
ncbi:MAG: class I SAM-dependent methyltransferase [Myxococcota bacterium]|nr:class I SAM-dependent methyltransferase [Myxococcota bacterium]